MIPDDIKENHDKMLEKYPDMIYLSGQEFNGALKLFALSQPQIEALEAKVEFYRETTDKVRKLVMSDKSIGLPGQPLYDAIVDKIEALTKERDELTKQLASNETGMTRITWYEQENKYKQTISELQSEVERLRLNYNLTLKRLKKYESNFD